MASGNGSGLDTPGRELLTAAEMRAIERGAIDAGEVTGLELMERAGQGVVSAMLDRWPELAHAPHRAVVLAGPGNNGGDGFVVARLLAQRGWEVRLCLFGDMARLPPDAAANAQRWLAHGEILPIGAASGAAAGADVCVDALFGAGLTRPLSDDLRAELAKVQTTSRPKRIVAIDAPSGLCMDSGRWLGGERGPGKPPLPAGLRADLTVTFHRPRIGHHLAEGPAACGALSVADIGLTQPAGLARTYLAGPPPAAALDKSPAAHKYRHGHALVLAGGVAKGGAARLAARAALRIGAGLVTLGPPPAALIENAAQLTAIMLRPVADVAALATLLEDPRFNALCLGPGLGVGERTRALVEAALGAGRAVVLDADALTSFEDEPGMLFRALNPRCVLTPHMGEFARLFPDLVERLHAPARRGPLYSKVDAAREAAEQAGCVVLLKGPDTVIAAPDGGACINSAHYDRAAPWLATAGAGDVLAGMITGLLARGLAPIDAAMAAAWLHVEAARRFGPGLIAEDLPEMLPEILGVLLR